MDHLRATSAPEAIIEPERDAWILMSARYPEMTPAIMADKVACRVSRAGNRLRLSAASECCRP
jgi:hypothetical protein